MTGKVVRRLLAAPALLTALIASPAWLALPVGVLLMVWLACGLALTPKVESPGPLAPASLAPERSELPSPPALVASYAIDVTLDPAAKTLAGKETITYTNTTTSAMPDLVFHLYLNAFRDPNSLFLKESPDNRGFAWDPQHPGHIDVTALRLKDGTPLTLEPLEDGTLARAALPAPVAPGQAVQVSVDFNALLPKVFARTGFAGQDFFMVGQWFPKLGVWQKGAWNAYPFHANSEFYADFGAYDVAITLPANYVTGGGGLLVGKQANPDGTQTVRYHSEPVIDFSFAASPHFRLATRQATGYGGKLEIAYLYLPEHAWTADRVLAAADRAVGYYSAWYGDYAYARLTLVDVPDDGQGAGGMEYPTLVTVGTLDVTGLGINLGRGDHTLETVAMHEVGHQWWQSVVAFNEAEEPWLDEGFTDFSSAKALDLTYGSGRSLYNLPGFAMGYADMRRLEYLTLGQTPMYGTAWSFSPEVYGIATYSKPVMALRTLENVLGERVFLGVMHTFFQRYAFAHPTTADFRSVVSEVTGQDQAWFFDGLVYTGGMVNYTVTALGDHSVSVERLGDVHLPTAVRVDFAGGSAMTEPWDGVESPRTFSYPNQPQVVGAQIDPNHNLTIEADALDNGRLRDPDVNAWVAVVTRLVYNLQSALLALGGF